MVLYRARGTIEYLDITATTMINKSACTCYLTSFLVVASDVVLQYWIRAQCRAMILPGIGICRAILFTWHVFYSLEFGDNR